MGTTSCTPFAFCQRQAGTCICLLGFFVFFFVLQITISRAEEKRAKPDPWREFWTGVDVSENTWLVYSGATLSPFGHIHEDGLRIRFTTGYGQYDYAGFRRVLDPTDCHPILGCRPVNRRFQFEAVKQYANILVGYLKRFGDLTTKVFIGAAYSDHKIGPKDPDNEVQGAEWGVKGGIELWLNIGETGWASLNTYYSTAHDTYSARARLGYLVLPTLSVGPEVAINGHIAEEDSQDLTYSRGRGGLFTRYAWAGGELSASGGVSVDIDEDITPYGTLTWMTRY